MKVTSKERPGRAHYALLLLIAALAIFVIPSTHRPVATAQAAQDELMKHLRAGAEAVQGGRYKESIEPLNKAIALKPDNDKRSIAYYLLGLAHTGLQNFPEAINAFKESVSTNPGFLNGQLGLGKALYSAQRYQEAIETYKQVVVLDKNSLNGYFSIGAAHAALGQYQEAVEPLKKAISLKPDFTEAHHYLGMVYIKLADKDAAVKEYETIKGKDQQLAATLLAEIEKFNAAVNAAPPPAPGIRNEIIGVATIKNRSGESMPLNQMRVQMMKRLVEYNYRATDLTSTEPEKFLAEGEEKKCTYILYAEIGRIINDRPNTDNGGGIGQDFVEVRITVKMFKPGEAKPIYENTILGREGRQTDQLGIQTIDRASREIVNALQKREKEQAR